MPPAVIHGRGRHRDRDAMRDLRVWIGLFLFAIGFPLLILLGLYLLLEVFSPGSDACSVQVWEDADCDGSPDQEERRLAGICVWCADRSLAWRPEDTFCQQAENRTARDGWWSYRSGVCRYVFLQTPEGFEPVTDTVVGCTPGIFGPRMVGFSRSSTCPRRGVLTPEGLVRQRFVRAVIVVFLVGVLVVGVPLLVYGRGKGPAERNLPGEKNS